MKFSCFPVLAIRFVGNLIRKKRTGDRHLREALRMINGIPSLSQFKMDRFLSENKTVILENPLG